MRIEMGIAAGALLLATTGAMGQTILGSDHDFSGKNWNNTGEVCVVCHTPHNADATVSDAPLWDHETTASTFVTYASATLDAPVAQPDGSSKMCLSCHDGTVAADNFGGRTNGSYVLSGNKLIGTDLRDDHPVSITYDAALAAADGELEDPSTATSGLGGTIAADLLISGKLQCSSCHDVHNGSGLGAFLVKSNTNSNLCFTCHTK